MTGEHLSNDATLATASQRKRKIAATAFKVVVSVTGAVFYYIQLPVFASFCFSERQSCKQIT